MASIIHKVILLLFFLICEVTPEENNGTLTKELNVTLVHKPKLNRIPNQINS